MDKSLIEILAVLKVLRMGRVLLLEFSQHGLNDLDIGFDLGHSYGLERRLKHLLVLLPIFSQLDCFLSRALTV